VTKLLNSRVTTCAVVALSAAATVSTYASDSKDEADVAQKQARSGAELSKTCAACHGAEGVSISADFPNIAGQYSSYLLHALKGYRSGERKDVVMQSFVKDLSDKELVNLAEFYAGQGGLETLSIED